MERWEVRFILVWTIALTGLVILLPALHRAHYSLLFWSEGYASRGLANAFLTGQPIDQPGVGNSLWSFLWLLAPSPDRLIWIVALSLAGVLLLLAHSASRLAGSVIAGVLATLILLFGVRDMLILCLRGSWQLGALLFGLLFLSALLDGRFWLACLAGVLAALTHLELWALPVFCAYYFAWVERANRGKSEVVLAIFSALLAPVSYLLLDYRTTGDWLRIVHSSAIYAATAGLDTLDFLDLAPRFLSELASTFGLVPLFLAGTAVVLRARSVVGSLRQSCRFSRGPGLSQQFRATVLDSPLVLLVLPVLLAWCSGLLCRALVSIHSHPLALALFALYAALLPFELLPRSRILAATAGLLLLLLLAVRLPQTSLSLRRDLKVTEAKVAALVELGRTLEQASLDLRQYRWIFIPFRRYGLLSNFVSDSVRRKLISYREVSLAVASTQALADGHDPGVPKGADARLRGLIRGRKTFADFLPALALWVPDDETHYIDVFSFDDPRFFRQNYLDRGRYGFRIVGAALDSLGLLYEVREFHPSELRPCSTLDSVPVLATPRSGLKAR